MIVFSAVSITDVVAIAAIGVSGLLVATLIRMGFYESLTGWLGSALQLPLLRLGILKWPSQGPYEFVDFSINVPGARRVFLVGTFNDWLRASRVGGRIIPDRLFAMAKEADERWHIRVRVLQPGSSHDYAFAVEYGTGFWIWTPDPDRPKRGHFGFSQITVPAG